MKQGVSMRALASDATEAIIDIIGVIGWEVEYDVLKGLMRSIPESVEKVVFEIYSPGGGVFDGNGIIQEIGELNGRVHTVANVQVAASMATLIACACKERLMAKNGRWLIHNPWSAVQGDAAEMEKEAEHLRATEIEAATFYADRTGSTPDEMLALMAEEKWIMPEEALEMGFVTAINDPFEVEAFAEVKAEIQAAGNWPTALAELPEIEEEVIEEVADEVTNEEIEEVEVAAEEPEAPKDPEPEPEPEVIDEASNEDGTEGESKEGEDEGDKEEPADDVEGVKELAAQDDGESYDKGKMDGIVIGRAQSEVEHADTLEDWKLKLEETDKLARKYQADKDRLENKLTDLREESEKRIKTLHDELEKAAAKLNQYVVGAMTFEASVETWEDAMVACGGEYPKAAKAYPELLKQWKAARRQEG